MDTALYEFKVRTGIVDLSEHHAAALHEHITIYHPEWTKRGTVEYVSQQVCGQYLKLRKEELEAQKMEAAKVAEEAAAATNGMGFLDHLWRRRNVERGGRTLGVKG